MGSKSKTKKMKSYRINKKEAEQKLKTKKRENALDIKCSTICPGDTKKEVTELVTFYLILKLIKQYQKILSS